MPQWHRAFQVFLTYTLINSHERFDFPKLGTRFPDVPADVFPLFLVGLECLPQNGRHTTPGEFFYLLCCDGAGGYVLPPEACLSSGGGKNGIIGKKLLDGHSFPPQAFVD